MQTMATRDRARRKELGFTQAEVARVSGLKQSDVSKIENGGIQKTTELLGLALALRCSPQWLVDGQGDMIAVNSAAPANKELTPSAMELAALFDLIPVSERLRRVEAFTAAAAAILLVLKGRGVTATGS